MGVFHVFKFIQTVPNRAKHHNYLPLVSLGSTKASPLPEANDSKTNVFSIHWGNLNENLNCCYLLPCLGLRLTGRNSTRNH